MVGKLYRLFDWPSSFERLDGQSLYVVGLEPALGIL